MPGLSAIGTAIYDGPTIAAPTAGTFPDLSLEWSPTTGPSGTPAWLQIPLSDIRSIDIDRGRNRELDRFQAGRMTVVLDNRDRLYDPQYSAGANFGNIKPMKRIRLRSTYAGVTYDLFSGYVDSWDQDYDMTKEAICTVTATDGFKVLSESGLPSSVWVAEINTEGAAVTHWFRFTQPVTGSDVLDIKNPTAVGEPIAAGGSSNIPTLGAVSLIAEDSDGAATFDSAVNQSVFVTAPFSIGVTTANDFTIEFVVAITGDTGNSQTLYQQSDANGLNEVLVRYQSTGQLSFRLWGPSGTVTTAASTGATVNDGNPHHIVCTYTTSGGAMRIYVDGTNVTSGSPTYTGETVLRQSHLGLGGAGALPLSFIGLDGVLDDVVIYNGTVLSATRILAHADAVFAPWNGDTTGERIGRVLDAIGWPAGERDVDTGNSTLQSAALDTSALSHANDARDTEYGELFMAPNGSVRFIARQNRWLPPYNDPIFTLSDDGSDLGYGALKFNYDDQLIRNHVTVGYDNGRTWIVNSSGSQDDFLIKSYGLTGLIGDVDTEGIDYANYIISRYDEPLLRVEGISIIPQRDPDNMWPAVLAADLVYQVNVERTPQGIGSAIDIDYTIEGISHRIEPKFWRTELQLSPADTPGALILDSTSQGILDLNTLGW